MSERFVHRHLPYLLARASHALWRGFEPQVRAAGLNSLEWRVLATLSDSEPVTVGQLALEVLAKQPTVTKSLDRLSAQGWVERLADATDARRARVRLTAEGHRKLTPQINIDGDPLVFDDFAYATREGLVPALVERKDAASIQANGLTGPFAEIVFDITLSKLMNGVDNQIVDRPRLAA